MNTVCKVSLVVTVAAILSACGGESGGADNEKSESAITEVRNLSTGTVAEPRTVYYDLDNAEIIDITDQQAETNQGWDIAFNRTKVFLNRFSDSPVAVYFTENTAGFYDSDGEAIVDRFTSATAETELDAFLSLAPVVPADEEFNTDMAEAAISGWYNYNSDDHTTSADVQSFFLVNSDNGIAKFRVTELVQNGFGMDSMILGASLQISGEEVFASEQLIPVSSADCSDAAYVDLHLGMAVTATDDWDISIPCDDTGLLSFTIDIADSRGAINDPLSTEADGIPSDNIQYMTWLPNLNVTRAFSTYGDENSPYGWGNYGVNGGHLLWSNFATYIVKTATMNYKFQITSYYDSESDSSGSYSFRFVELSESE